MIVTREKNYVCETIKTHEKLLALKAKKKQKKKTKTKQTNKTTTTNEQNETKKRHILIFFSSYTHFAEPANLDTEAEKK